MTGKDRFWVSFRYIKGRLVESILVIVATTIGIALVAAMVAFIQAYDNQTNYLLNHPAYRELLVEVIGNETELTEPAAAYDPSTSREIRLGAENIDAALDDAPLVEYGYLADAEYLSTGMPGAGIIAGGPGGGFGGGMGQLRNMDIKVTPSTGSSDDPDSEGGFTVQVTPEEGAEGFTFEVPQGVLPEGFSGTPPEGFEPPDGMEPPEGAAVQGFFGRRGQTTDERGEGDARRFDLEQFFETDPDVVTELPLDRFAAGRITAQFFEAYGLTAESGSLITTEDVEQGNQVVVLGNTLAGILFPDQDPVGTRVRLNLQTYTIIGVLAPTPLADIDTNTLYNRVAFVPNGDAQVSFGGNTVRFQRPTRTLRFAVADSATLTEATEQLQAHFDAEYGEGTIRITAPIDELTAERSRLGRILAVVLFLATAGLFIASINVFNLMLMRVIKRTKSVGISRAIGSTRNGVFRQFFNEAALMTGIAAAIGLAISPLVYRMLGRALVPEAATGSVNVVYLVVGTIAAMLFSMLFGVYPARQAARVDAAVAIRTE